MTKTQILKALRIEAPTKGEKVYFIAVGSGVTYRVFGAAVNEKAAKTLRASIRRNPEYYGIN